MPLVGLEIDDEKRLEKYLDLLERSEGHVLSPGLPLDSVTGGVLNILAIACQYTYPRCGRK